MPWSWVLTCFHEESHMLVWEKLNKKFQIPTILIPTPLQGRHMSILNHAKKVKRREKNKLSKL